jgi:hypothetical protein
VDSDAGVGSGGVEHARASRRNGRSPPLPARRAHPHPPPGGRGAGPRAASDRTAGGIGGAKRLQPTDAAQIVGEGALRAPRSPSARRRSRRRNAGGAGGGTGMPRRSLHAIPAKWPLADTHGCGALRPPRIPSARLAVAATDHGRRAPGSGGAKRVMPPNRGTRKYVRRTCATGVLAARRHPGEVAARRPAPHK